jgi:hypothetical protein
LAGIFKTPNDKLDEDLGRCLSLLMGMSRSTFSRSVIVDTEEEVYVSHHDEDTLIFKGNGNDEAQGYEHRRHDFRAENHGTALEGYAPWGESTLE